MPKTIFTLLLCFLQTTVFSQETRGKVYAKDKPLANVYILNYTQNSQTVTDAEGNFSLSAKVNDSLIVAAPEYAVQHFKLKPYQLEEVWVVELTEALHTLNEVKLTTPEMAKPFNLKEYDSTFNAAIVEDRKKNPHLYYPQGSQQGIDFIQLAGMIVKLFKRKDPVYESLDYKDIQQLFETDDFFDQEFLREQLKVPKAYEMLFFDFCAAQGLSERLLLPENQLELIDFFVEQSAAYHKLILEVQED